MQNSQLHHCGPPRAHRRQTRSRNRSRVGHKLPAAAYRLRTSSWNEASPRTITGRTRHFSQPYRSRPTHNDGSRTTEPTQTGPDAAQQAHTTTPSPRPRARAWHRSRIPDRPNRSQRAHRSSRESVDHPVAQEPPTTSQDNTIRNTTTCTRPRSFHTRPGD